MSRHWPRRGAGHEPLRGPLGTRVLAEGTVGTGEAQGPALPLVAVAPLSSVWMTLCLSWTGSTVRPAPEADPSPRGPGPPTRGRIRGTTPPPHCRAPSLSSAPIRRLGTSSECWGVHGAAVWPEPSLQVGQLRSGCRHQDRDVRRAELGALSADLGRVWRHFRVPGAEGGQRLLLKRKETPRERGESRAQRNAEQGAGKIKEAHARPPVPLGHPNTGPSPSAGPPRCPPPRASPARVDAGCSHR